MLNCRKFICLMSSAALEDVKNPQIDNSADTMLLEMQCALNVSVFIYI